MQIEIAEKFAYNQYEYPTFGCAYFFFLVDLYVDVDLDHKISMSIHIRMHLYSNPLDFVIFS